jgi:hypothetical protein
MNNWLHAGWSGFLSDRVALYELCELCHEFPGAGTPTQYTGLNRRFSDSVCAEIDKGLAQYRIWYTGRMKQQQKVGKHRYKPAFQTLDDVLGVTEALRRGGWDGQELTDVSGDYKQAVIEAAKKGLPAPDINMWMAARSAPPDEY